jgi:glucokinase
MTDVLLGVDIGGTTTAAGLVTPGGEVLSETQAPTHRAGPGTAERTIVELIESARGEAAARGLVITGIGVGAPGVVDATGGRIGEHVPNVPELAGQPLAASLASRFGLPVFLDNDVNALALAEWIFGPERGARSLVVLAPGTGFGAAIILEARLVRGAAGFAGERGHAPVKFDGRPCWCGGRGCLAVYASGRGLAEAARDAVGGEAGAALVTVAGGDPLGITAAHVFQLADAGDPLAMAIADEAGQALAAMIGGIVNGLNPEAIVITGGVAVAYARCEKKIMRAAAGYAFERALATTRVRFIPGDKRRSMRGAAALVLYETGAAGGGARGGGGQR